MFEECKTCWIPEIADLMVCEVINQMSGICLAGCSKEEEKQLETVYGLVDGDYQMQLWLRAEPRLFNRLAKNMIGEDPADEEEVKEYAVEMFNILCGRFISELYEVTGHAAKFFPTSYGNVPCDLSPAVSHEMCIRSFFSDEQEYVEFAWSKVLRGNKCWKVQKS